MLARRAGLQESAATTAAASSASGGSGDLKKAAAALQKKPLPKGSSFARRGSGRLLGLQTMAGAILERDAIEQELNALSTWPNELCAHAGWVRADEAAGANWGAA